jgi:hypothetical protein
VLDDIKSGRKMMLEGNIEMRRRTAEVRSEGNKVRQLAKLNYCGNMVVPHFWD